jgi:predicted transcriptional regulator
MDTYGTKRLAYKNAKEAIIKQIGEDFNLTPILAKAHYEQMEKYFKEHINLRPNTGQISYEAIVDTDAPGKAIADCKRKAVMLTLCHNEDLKILADKGLSSARQNRIQRITQEAKAQGVLLTHEDLSYLLCTSPSTVKRDIAKLRKAGFFIPTRGQIKDIGKGISHKTKIVDMYVRGYQFTEIEHRTNHSSASIIRYLKDFSQVALLTKKKLTLDEIRLTMGISERLIKEYQTLYKRHLYNGSSRRLKQLLDEYSPDEPKKGVLWV